MKSKVVFISGCYDIIHGGHIEFFKQAKEFGDKLVVSFAGNNVLELVKGRKSSIPEQHKKKLLEAITIIDEVVIGDDVEVIGLDFVNHFKRIKPDYLVVTEDDKFESQKRQLCEEVGCKYVMLPKTLNYEKISTTEIVNWIKAPKEVPVRVDFAGGWLDVPKYAMERGLIVNCAIEPKVSLVNWDYKIGGGLGGSAAYAILSGKNPVESELDLGVGWQDPAVILETGLCVWRSGPTPVLDCRHSPDFIRGKMYLYWTGNEHNTPSVADKDRDYDLIFRAGVVAKDAVSNQYYLGLCRAVSMSYEVQLKEGMKPLPDFGEDAKKYCGGGFGGYALYLFNENINNKNFIKVEPYEKTF